MNRPQLFLIEMRRAARIFGRAFVHLFNPPKEWNGPSTADWHEPPAGHPSLLCKCPEGGNGHWAGHHLADCPWLAAMCKTCEGTGWCSVCGGDGCERLQDAG